MKKLAIYIFVAFGVLFFAGVALAHGDKTALTADDLGVSEPTLLPTSPFYFVKEWSRGIRLFFTFNSLAKAELELRFADEKVIEAKEVAERTPERARALEKRRQRYCRFAGVQN